MERENLDGNAHSDTAEKDKTIAGKKTNVKPMWDKLWKNLDIEEPAPPLDQVYLGCTQRECKTNTRIC